MRVERPGAGSATEFRPMMLAVFANTPFYGGGMRLAPRAAIDDHRLDFCFVPRMNKVRLSYLFPTVYYGGHLKIPEVEYFQADRLRLETERPVEVYADGECVSYADRGGSRTSRARGDYKPCLEARCLRG
jgi:diacylglycerol kinase family enzyme